MYPLEFGLHRFQAGLLGAFLVLQSLLLLFEPGRIVPFPGNTMPAIEFENPAGNIIEKVAIVGHRDHGSGEVLEKTFEPGYRFGVEVVSGFVQDQHVGIRQ